MLFQMTEPEYEILSLEMLSLGLGITKFSFDTDLRVVLIMLSDLLSKSSQTYVGTILFAIFVHYFRLI